MTEYTPINPKHYRDLPTGFGLECIEYIRYLPYGQASAGKYLYRAGNKDALEQDLEKTLWYIDDAIQNDMVVDLRDIKPDLVKTIDKEATYRSFLFYCLVTGRLDIVSSNITSSLESEPVSLPSTLW